MASDLPAPSIRRPAPNGAGWRRQLFRVATVLVVAVGAASAGAGVAYAAAPQLRFFYSWDFPVTSIGSAPVHASFDDAFTALRDCFSCSFPVPGAPTGYPSEGQYLPLRPCFAGPIGCINAPVRAYGRDQDGYLELVAQPGHFDGAGSTVTFYFYTASDGTLHMNVTAYVASSASSAFPPDPVNKAFANATWSEFARNIGDFIYIYVCGSLYCPAPPPTPTGSATPCSQLHAIVCTGGTATVLDPTCPGGQQQWFNATDGNGVAMHYTYADDARACMRVRYDTYPTSQTCAFWMYVPKGFATGNIVFGWWDTSGVKHYWWINERPIEGWQFIFNAANVTRIEWQDNNGQYPNSTYLGWSSDNQHGYAQRC